MTKPIDAAKDAIRALHEHISALGIAAKEASVLLRNAIAEAIGEITGSTKPRGRGAARAASATSKPKAARKGGKRGAKPGGRQLKAFLGVKTYDALEEDVRAKGRSAIHALKATWKGLSKKEQADVLAKAGIRASSGGRAPAKAGKPRKARKAKPAGAVMPKLETSPS